MKDLSLRDARPADLDAIEDMMYDFAKGHPAEHHPRSRAKLEAALFGPVPVAKMLVATHRGRIVGMGQWVRIYDMFWGMFGANAEWLYVRPAYRGRGIAAVIVAELCARVRAEGGEFLHGGGGDGPQRLYERVAMGWTSAECYLSAEAFQVFADLAGRTPREIVRGLPSPELNKVAARPRGGA